MSATRSFIPAADAAFDTFQQHFVATVVAKPGDLDLTPADAAALQADQAEWTPAYAEHNSAATDGLAANKAKDEGRGAFEAVIRAKVKLLNAMPDVTNATRLAAGINAHAEARTPSRTPTTRPIARIVPLGGRRHVVHWVDEATPQQRRRPAGAGGAHLFLKIGEPAPVDVTGCIPIGLVTATPYTRTFDAADVGKTAYWFVAWAGKKSGMGPLSLLGSARIPE